MNLEKHFDGAAYLKPGIHIVTVKKFEMKTINGNPWVEFTLESEDGGTIRRASCCNDASEFFIAQFAVACGFTREDLRTYEHFRLVGLKVQIVVVAKPPNAEGKVYHEVASYVGVDVNIPEPQPIAPQPVADLPTPQLTPEVEAQHVDPVPF